MSPSKTEITEENTRLRQIVKDTFWMARRYANGRQTYAPSIIREHYPYVKERGLVEKDKTLEKDYKWVNALPDRIGSDFLLDCNE